MDVAYEEAAQRRLAAVEVERAADARSEAAVLAGLSAAKQQVLGGEEPVAAAAAAAVGPAAREQHAGAAPAAGVAAAGAEDVEEARAAAEDAANYPPLVFEPGSLDKIGRSDAPAALQVGGLAWGGR